MPPFKEPSLLHKVITVEAAALPERYSAGLKELVFRDNDWGFPLTSIR